ncbi:hypothetical protein [Parasphingorhabdus marina]|nr:hypothetical protein [Parasphingorhabdus marina]
MAMIYMAFLFLAIAASSRMRPVQAVTLVYLAGIVFLPVSPPVDNLPSLESAGASPYWVMPAALPADIFFTKAAIASLAALLVALLFGRSRLNGFRFHWADLPILAWCLWPLLQSLWVDASPAGWHSSLYLFCVWGIPWFLGRIYLANRNDQLIFVRHFVGLSLLLLPIILFETVSEVRLHELVYGPHPFADVGAQRYFGYRPLAFFEDGNQYGLWIASAALLAIWRAKHAAAAGRSRSQLAVALLLLVMAIASQSAGALILLFAGLMLMLFPPAFRLLRKAAVPALVLFGALMAVYLSGALPLRTIAKETTAGQIVWSTLRASGRGSLAWRIGQDQKTLPAIKEHIVAGSGQWDWWRELGKRPWGLPLLMIGQFGLIGFGLAAAIALRALWIQISSRVEEEVSGSRTRNPAAVLAILLVMALIDAMLNAFLIMPAIMAAGAISVVRSRRRSE